MSKINSDFLKKNIHDMLEERKKRKFVEAVELQIGIRDYDPDKRFNGSIRLPNIAHQKIKVKTMPLRSASSPTLSTSRKQRPTKSPLSTLTVSRPLTRTESKSKSGPRSTTSFWLPIPSANRSPSCSATFWSK